MKKPTGRIRRKIPIGKHDTSDHARHIKSPNKAGEGEFDGLNMGVYGNRIVGEGGLPSTGKSQVEGTMRIRRDEKSDSSAQRPNGQQRSPGEKVAQHERRRRGHPSTIGRRNRATTNAAWDASSSRCTKYGWTAKDMTHHKQTWLSCEKHITARSTVLHRQMPSGKGYSTHKGNKTITAKKILQLRINVRTMNVHAYRDKGRMRPADAGDDQHKVAHITEKFASENEDVKLSVPAHLSNMIEPGPGVAIWSGKVDGESSCQPEEETGTTWEAWLRMSPSDSRDAKSFEGIRSRSEDALDWGAAQGENVGEEIIERDEGTIRGQSGEGYDWQGLLTRGQMYPRRPRSLPRATTLETIKDDLRMSNNGRRPFLPHAAVRNASRNMPKTVQWRQHTRRRQGDRGTNNAMTEVVVTPKHHAWTG
ncbi:hypothetical protein BDZ89DRAFT_1055198 [Hymenopellis radicata]|nr:hypothetical protein BDZ89DRAFT_1055198 [Hymenopellis radicata]